MAFSTVMGSGTVDPQAGHPMLQQMLAQFAIPQGSLSGQKAQAMLQRVLRSLLGHMARGERTALVELLSSGVIQRLQKNPQALMGALNKFDRGAGPGVGSDTGNLGSDLSGAMAALGIRMPEGPRLRGAPAGAAGPIPMSEVDAAGGGAGFASKALRGKRGSFDPIRMIMDELYPKPGAGASREAVRAWRVAKKESYNAFLHGKPDEATKILKTAAEKAKPAVKGGGGWMGKAGGALGGVLAGYALVQMLQKLLLEPEQTRAGFQAEAAGIPTGADYGPIIQAQGSERQSAMLQQLLMAQMGGGMGGMGGQTQALPSESVIGQGPNPLSALLGG